MWFLATGCPPRAVLYKWNVTFHDFIFLRIDESYVRTSFPVYSVSLPRSAGRPRILHRP